MEDSYCPVPDSESNDTAESFQSNNSNSNSENAMQGYAAEASTNAHNASTVTKENTAVNDTQEISQLDHLVFDLDDHPNEQIDMSSPIKSGKFYPEFFPDNNQFSPITPQSPGCKCSKGTVCTVEPLNLISKVYKSIPSYITVGLRYSYMYRK